MIIWGDKMPKISVLMPVFNGEKYLREAINSIINQTFKDFEFLIINDGSTDKSEEIIKSYEDSRIQLINNEKNLKLIATLNKGLSLAKGDYIARMDCDDISHPKRLEIQYKIMDKDKTIAVCGTGFKLIGKPFFSNRKKITNPIKIKNSLYSFNCIAHPSVMIRKSVIQESNLKYQEDYLHAEDYQFFQSLSEHHKIVNLNISLLNYRLSPEGIGRKYKAAQENTVAKISTEALSKIGINFDRTKYNSSNLKKKDLREIKNKLNDLYYHQITRSNEKNIKGVIHYLWLDYCTKASSFGIWTLIEFWSFKPLNFIFIDLHSVAKLHVKCFIKKG